MCAHTYRHTHGTAYMWRSENLQISIAWVHRITFPGLATNTLPAEPAYQLLISTVPSTRLYELHVFTLELHTPDILNSIPEPHGSRELSCTSSHTCTLKNKILKVQHIKLLFKLIPKILTLLCVLQ